MRRAVRDEVDFVGDDVAAQEPSDCTAWIGLWRCCCLEGAQRKESEPLLRGVRSPRWRSIRILATQSYSAEPLTICNVIDCREY